jgi:hypothetical protein
VWCFEGLKKMFVWIVLRRFLVETNSLQDLDVKNTKHSSRTTFKLSRTHPFEIMNTQKVTKRYVCVFHLTNKRLLLILLQHYLLHVFRHLLWV